MLVLALGPLVQAPAEVERDSQGRVTRTATVDKDDLRAGDCVNDTELLELEPGGGLDNRATTTEVVPCADVHDFEVSATFTLPDTNYAEAADLHRAANRECVRQLRRTWAGDGQLLRDKLLAYYLPPVTGPQEQVVCLLQLASGERMRGSIR